MVAFRAKLSTGPINLLLHPTAMHTATCSAGVRHTGTLIFRPASIARRPIHNKNFSAGHIPAHIEISLKLGFAAEVLGCETGIFSCTTELPLHRITESQIKATHANPISQLSKLANTLYSRM